MSPSSEPATSSVSPQAASATHRSAAPAEETEGPSKDGEDERLMRAYKEGDVQAFHKLVERHEGPLYRFCLRALGDKEQAADATQEVFMRIVRNATRWERKAKFTTWMYTIARNYCIDESRKARFRRTDSLNETIGQEDDGGTEKLDRVEYEGPDSARLTDSHRIRAVVDSALAELPEEQRQVFCLREYGGLAFKDIAETVGVGENTVKSRMRYALAALRKALVAAGFHPPNSS